MDRRGRRRELSAHQRRVIPELDIRGGPVRAHHVKGRPVDPVVFRRVNRLDTVGILEVEVQRQPGKVEIRQVSDRRVLERVVRVVQDCDREVTGIPKRTADPEAVRRCVVNRRGSGESIETTQINRAIGLKFEDTFGQGNLLWLDCASASGNGGLKSWYVGWAARADSAS